MKNALRTYLADYLRPLGVAGLLIVVAILITWTIQMIPPRYTTALHATPVVQQSQVVDIPSFLNATTPSVRKTVGVRVVKASYRPTRAVKVKSRFAPYKGKYRVKHKHRHRHRFHHHPRRHR